MEVVVAVEVELCILVVVVGPPLTSPEPLEVDLLPQSNVVEPLPPVVVVMKESIPVEVVELWFAYVPMLAVLCALLVLFFRLLLVC